MTYNVFSGTLNPTQSAGCLPCSNARSTSRIIIVSYHIVTYHIVSYRIVSYRVVDCEGREFDERRSLDARREPAVPGQHGSEDGSVVREHQGDQSCILLGQVLAVVTGTTVSARRTSGPERL